MKRFFLTLALWVALAGCASLSSDAWVRSEVYFGLSRPDGTLVSEADWQTFVDQVITPEFPSGLSVVDTAGQWKNKSGQIDHEHSKMLILLHPRSEEIEARIDKIRAEYCRRFQQEAVMKVTSSAKVEF